MRIKVLAALLAFTLALSGGVARAQLNKTALLSQMAGCFPTQTTGAITPSVMLTCITSVINSFQQFPGVNPQTGTSYTVSVNDYGQLITFNNASAVAVTLPAATGAFCPFNFYITNIGAGGVTITPQNGSLINGAASLAMAQNQNAFIVSDCSNYQLGSITSTAGSSGTITSGVTLFASGVNGQCAYDNSGLLGTVGCVTLTGTDQAFSGGVTLTSYNPTAGNYAVDCGLGPVQYIFNVGAFNITAPQKDSSCIVGIINASGSGTAVGAVTLVNFSPSSPAGSTITTTPTKSAVSVTFTSATPTVITWTSHGLSLNSPVYFTAVAMPTGITANQVYYVSNVVNANTFQIATSPVATTTTGVGASSTGTTVVGTEPSVWFLGINRINGLALGSLLQAQ